MAQDDYIRTDEPQVHFRRHREILAKHPEIRELTGPERRTPIAIVLLVAAQFALLVLVHDLPWWAVLLVAYGVGAVISHALYVMIHDCTHNLAAKSTTANRLWGIFSDFPLGIPSAMTFRTYHLIHHRHLGELDLDADIATRLEGRIVGGSWWRKALWLLGFGLSQALRPLRVKAGRTITAWTVLNVAIVLGIDVLVVVLFGPLGLVYLLASTLFALGLHPLGGRWIQEHYVTRPGQETYSYYGPANLVAFNVGYHVEHHDFMNVAWVNLPKVTRAAPEFYADLASYRSWTALVLKFIFDPTLTPFSRILHPCTSRAT